eukprot:5439844-Amphidinium_carterae.1
MLHYIAYSSLAPLAFTVRPLVQPLEELQCTLRKRMRPTSKSTTSNFKLLAFAARICAWSSQQSSCSYTCSKSSDK